MSLKDIVIGPFMGNKAKNKLSPSPDQKSSFRDRLKLRFGFLKERLKQTKKSTIVFYIVVFLLVLYLIGFFTSLLRMALNLNLQRDVFQRRADTATTPKYKPAWLPWEAFLCIFDIKYSIWIIIAFILIFAYFVYWYIKNHAAMGTYILEERAGGVFLRQVDDVSMGSARKMTNKEIVENFKVLTPKEFEEEENNPNTLIFGRQIESGNYILDKPFPYEKMPNRNCFVIGDAGSRKTSNFIVPALKQISRSGNNVICTDPAGEAYALTSEEFRARGYDVFVINTTEPDRSDSMNFIKACGSDIDLAKKITDIFIQATDNPNNKVDDYFYRGMKALFPAMILLANIKLNQYSSINGMINFLLDHNSIEDMELKFKTYKDEAPEAYRQFRLFKKSPTPDSFISNLSQRLDLFTSIRIASICSNDSFDIIEQYGSKDKKTIIYLITDDTYAFIGAMYLNIFSKLLVKHAMRNCEKRILPRKLFFVFEEFLTMGYVPNMGTFLSANRKFGFVYYLICQAIPQFFLKYNEKEAQEIMSNCKFKLLYGAGDMETAKFIEEFCGITTVRTAMTSYSNQITKSKDQAREGVQQRNLYNADEIYALNEKRFILLTNHRHPLELEKPYYETLPCYAEDDFEEVHYIDYEPHKLLGEADNRKGNESKANKSKEPKQPDKPEEPEHPNVGNSPSAPLSFKRDPDSGKKKELTIVIKAADEVPPSDPQISNGISMSRNNTKPGEKQKPAARRTKKEREREEIEKQFTGNLIDSYEESPERRPCVNESEVMDGEDGGKVFIPKDNQNGKLKKAYKVVFKINLTTTKVKGKLPDNRYFSYTSKINIDDIVKELSLTEEGKILIGFKRTYSKNGKTEVQEYHFDDPPKNHIITVPQADTIISPVFRAIPGYVPAKPSAPNANKSNSPNVSKAQGYKI